MISRILFNLVIRRRLTSNRIPQRKLDFLPTPRSNSKIWFTHDFPRLEIAQMMDITAFLLKAHSMAGEQFTRRFFRRRLPSSLQTISRASHIPNKPLADSNPGLNLFAEICKNPNMAPTELTLTKGQRQGALSFQLSDSQEYRSSSSPISLPKICLLL